MSNNNILYLDIETIVSQDSGIKEKLLSELKIPGNISKPESIKKWYEEKAPLLLEEAYLKTALDGTTGEIISIAWCFNEKPVEGCIRTLDEPESKILNIFYEALEEAETDYLIWVSHNINFDLPFLLKRSIINQVRPSVGIPYTRSKGAFCTMEAWAGYNKYITLDSLCKALGIPGKDGMCGSDVWSYVQQSRYDEILQYNKNDVSLLRQVYERITFKHWLPSDPKDETTIANEEDAQLEKSGFFDKTLQST